MSDWNMDIFYLFQAMIFQFQKKDYRTAVLLYHRCNFYALHPIHYYRLYQCYMELGLYWRADVCFSIAKDHATFVPSIGCASIDHIQDKLRLLKCGGCDIEMPTEIPSSMNTV